MSQQKKRRQGTLAKALRAQKRSAYVTAILDAGEIVIGEDGFDGATMASIAKVAGVSVGTLYNYFPSKDDVFDGIKARAIADLLSRIDNSVAEGAPEAQLKQLARAIFEFIAERGALIGVGRGLGARAEAPEGQERFAERVAEVVIAGMESGLIRADVELTVLIPVFGGVLSGTIDAWLRDRDAFHLPDRADAVVDIFLDGARPATGVR